jgi:hypothetical protein
MPLTPQQQQQYQQYLESYRRFADRIVNPPEPGQIQLHPLPPERWAEAQRRSVMLRDAVEQALRLVETIQTLQAEGFAPDDLVNSVATTGFPVGDVPAGAYEALLWLEVFANLVRLGEEEETPF